MEEVNTLLVREDSVVTDAPVEKLRRRPGKILGKFTNCNLLKYRAARNLTQEKLALNIGVWPSVISLWETGQVGPSPINARKLIDFFGCTAEEMFGEETKPVSTTTTADTSAYYDPEIEDEQVNLNPEPEDYTPETPVSEEAPPQAV